MSGSDAQQRPPHPQAKTILARRLVQRCLKEWRAQCWERRWKVQLAIKDKQLQLLASEVSCVGWVGRLVVDGPRHAKCTCVGTRWEKSAWCDLT